ncbi:unnamed protein product [Zymoseptoria tritici ST99CH_1A5]|uniref:Uncharacterized protein n=1 Tax=Zymoseptoria tritici ST99CH_1A5 TaxID=1276529 RepID=A0A1Y6LWD7_ZYMTR|nr:unnamed protein product [Zymoseptoria tritici ST99CH_1A5]
MADVAILKEVHAQQHLPRSRTPLSALHHNTASSTQQAAGKTPSTPATSSPLPPTVDLTATHLISSPYSDALNQLHLPSLSLPSRLFALALTALRPIRPDYATAPYLESFNWTDVFALLRILCHRSNHEWKASEFYVVIFRSKLLETADRERLGLLDEMSHREACESGGLLKYWFGSTDGQRRNLATCLWSHREDAAKGGAGPWHKQARASARVMYESITFHTHKLVVDAGADSWRLEEYQS